MYYLQKIFFLLFTIIVLHFITNGLEISAALTTSLIIPPTLIQSTIQLTTINTTSQISSPTSPIFQHELQADPPITVQTISYGHPQNSHFYFSTRLSAPNEPNFQLTDVVIDAPLGVEFVAKVWCVRHQASYWSSTKDHLISEIVSPTEICPGGVDILFDFEVDFKVPSIANLKLNVTYSYNFSGGCGKLSPDNCVKTFVDDNSSFDPCTFPRVAPYTGLDLVKTYPCNDLDKLYDLEEPPLYTGHYEPFSSQLDTLGYSFMLTEISFLQYNTRYQPGTYKTGPPPTYSIEEPIPSYLFRLHFVLPRPLKKGLRTQYIFELTTPAYEFSTNFVDPISTRQNLHFPPSYPNHPEYEFYFNATIHFKRTPEQQELMTSSVPFCLLNGVLPLALDTSHSAQHFSLHLDLWDTTQDEVFNSQAMKNISFQCFNIALKTVSPTGYRTYSSPNARSVDVKISHMIYQHPREAFADPEAYLDPTKLIFSHQIVRCNAFSISSIKKNSQLADSIQKELPFPLTTFNPSTIQCSNQIGYNANSFFRCVITDTSGNFFSQMEDLTTFFLSNELLDGVSITVRQLSLHHGSNKMHSNTQRHLDSKSSNYVPYLFDQHKCSPLVNSTIAHECRYLPHYNSSKSPNVPNFVEFDPTAPIIIDLYVKYEPNSQKPFQQPLLGLSLASLTNKSPSLLFPPFTSIKPQSTSSTSGHIDWKNETKKFQIEDFFRWGYKFDISERSAIHDPFHFLYKFSYVPPNSSSSSVQDIILKEIYFYFPSRNFRFKPSPSTVCFIDTKSKDSLEASELQFGQFPDYMSADINTMKLFNHTSYADVLIIRELGERLPVGETTVRCSIETELNPVYHPPDEINIQTSGHLALLFKTESQSHKFYINQDLSGDTNTSSQFSNNFQLQQSTYQFTWSLSLTNVVISTPGTSGSNTNTIQWILFAFLLSILFLFFLALAILLRTQLISWLRQVVLCFCPFCIPHDRKRYVLNSTLKDRGTNKKDDVVDGSLSKFSKDIQKKILLRRQHQTATALIKSNRLTSASGLGKGRYDIETGTIITPKQQLIQQAHSLAGIHSRQAQLATLSSQSPQDNLPGSKLTEIQTQRHQLEKQYEQDRDTIEHVLANTGQYQVPLPNDLAADGKLRKRRTMYQ